ncbi:DinB family protein [uncultured Algibacter sp.]|uniref:DinB family protein n=1 Tax=uncultured Algibacter sp. TaxID=298659 RepID=UPI00260E9619|nr:DinB family protein [uncultured Algibacter sp.]
MKKSEITTSEYHKYYSAYLAQIDDKTELLEGYLSGLNVILNFFQSIPSDILIYRYAEGKWSVKEIFQHLIDAERVFTHRCFRIARHDKTSLAGFDENDYIEPSGANDKSIETLIEEFEAVRQNSIVMLKNFKANDLNFVGNANGSSLSARASAFINLGHYMWHIKIVKERYL